MSCGHLADGVRAVLGDGSAVGVRLRYMEEPQPLGTGGALKYAEELLDERFLMLNGDVLTDLDLTAQLARTSASGARATLALYPVEDPCAYGLVRLADDGAVREFVEKPAPDQIDTNNISAGVYVLERRCWICSSTGERGLDRARRVPAAGRQRALRPRLAAATGRTSGRRSATSRRRSTSSRATVATEVAARHGRDVPVRGGRRHARRAGSSRAALIEAGCGSPTGARIGGRAVLERNVIVGAGTIDRERRRDGGRARSARTARCTTASSRRACEIGDHCVDQRAQRRRRGRDARRGQQLSNGARLFPGVSLPEGALLF